MDTPKKKPKTSVNNTQSSDKNSSDPTFGFTCSPNILGIMTKTKKDFFAKQSNKGKSLINKMFDILDNKK